MSFSRLALTIFVARRCFWSCDMVRRMPLTMRDEASGVLQASLSTGLILPLWLSASSTSGSWESSLSV